MWRKIVKEMLSPTFQARFSVTLSWYSTMAISNSLNQEAIKAQPYMWLIISSVAGNSDINPLSCIYIALYNIGVTMIVVPALSSILHLHCSDKSSSWHFYCINTVMIAKEKVFPQCICFTLVLQKSLQPILLTNVIKRGWRLAVYCDSDLIFQTTGCSAISFGVSRLKSDNIWIFVTAPSEGRATL